MSNGSSCLVTKLSHYISLSDVDLKRLAALEKSERTFGAGEEVYQGGDVNNDLYVVKHGWAFSYTDLPDGRRQIVKIHHPGDVIGFPDVALKHSTTTLRTVEEVCLCPFPKTALDEILRESPKLLGPFYVDCNAGSCCPYRRAAGDGPDECAGACQLHAA